MGDRLSHKKSAFRMSMEICHSRCTAGRVEASEKEKVIDGASW
jgi:hypothetical protein